MFPKSTLKGWLLPPFFLFQLFFSQAYAASLQPYFIVDSQAHSDTVSISDALDDWEGDDFTSGKQQWAWSWLEIGVKYQHWGVGFVQRSDFDLRFSKDTAELYWRSANKKPLPLGRAYSTALDANGLKASGLRLMFADAWGESAHYSFGLSYLRATYILDGSMGGAANVVNESDYEFELLIDYHYTEDSLFDRTVDEPSGQGFAIDAEFNYQFSEATSIDIQVRDLFANVYWSESPYTEGRATSERKEYDENGYVSINPALTGFEGIDSQYVQRLSPRWHAQLSHSFIGPYGALLQYRHQYGRSLFALGATLSVGQGAVSSSYWPMQNLIEIDWRYRKLRFSIAADQLDKSELKSVWLSMSYGQ